MASIQKRDHGLIRTFAGSSHGGAAGAVDRCHDGHLKRFGSPASPSYDLAEKRFAVGRSERERGQEKSSRSGRMQMLLPAPLGTKSA